MPRRSDVPLDEFARLTGRVLTATGQPVRNAFVEIWQVDTTGSYVHTRGRQPAGHDANFQGYGRFLTDSKGQYYFRTIKPISYTLIGIFRTAHIHFALGRTLEELEDGKLGAALIGSDTHPAPTV